MVIYFLLQTKHNLPDHTQMFDDKSQKYRWFLLPSEAEACLRGNAENYARRLPFCPPHFRQGIGLPPVTMDVADTNDGTLYDGNDGNVKTSHVASGDIQCDAGKGSEKFSNRLIEDLDRGFKGRDEVCTSSENSEIIKSEKCLVGREEEKNTSGVEGSETMLDCQQQSRTKSCDENGSACEKESIGVDTDAYKVTDSIGNTISAESGNQENDNSESMNARTSDNESYEKPGVKLTQDVTDSSQTNGLVGMQEAENSKAEPEISRQSSKNKRAICSDGSCDWYNKSECTLSKQRRTEAIVSVSGSTQSSDGKSAQKDKKMCKWFSPPKTIFTHFLKVCHFFF